MKRKPRTIRNVEVADIEFATNAPAPPSFTSDALVPFLDAMPCATVVLDAGQRIVATNRALRDLLGMSRPESLVGECLSAALTCIHASDSALGCRSHGCRRPCGLLQVPERCAATGEAATDDVTVQTRQAANGGALEYRVHATPLWLDGEPCVCVALADVQHERRRVVLERMLFDDVREACTALLRELRESAASRTDAAEQLRLQRLEALGARVHDSVETQHLLHRAETGELDTHEQPIALAPFVRELLLAHEPCAAARGITLRAMPAPEGTCVSDPALVRRVLHVLLTNAIEAAPAGSAITLRCAHEEHGTRIAVHDTGWIPDYLQPLLFQRGFTTRSEPGRGLGLHFARMLVQYYLDATIDCTSDRASGTTFTLLLKR